MLKSLNHYRFVLWAWLSFLGLNLFSRLLLLFIYKESLNHESFLSLLYGIRMDTIIFCAFAVVFTLLYALKLRLFLRIGLTLFATTVVFLEISTWGFYAQFASRPNFLFIEHAKNSTEILGMIWRLYPIGLTVMTVFLLGLTFFLFQLSNKITISTSLKQRWMTFPLIIIVLFFGMRSSLDDSTPNPSFYTFSSDQTNNEIANNSLFSVLFAWHWASKEYFGEYGNMDEEDIFSRLAAQNKISSNQHLIRQQLSSFEGKKNVILILLESFGSDHVGYLGGTPTTPNLDKMAAEGMAFHHMYAAGTRTSWGVSSVLTGLYPLPNREYVKALKSQQHFYTIAQSFKQQGYQNTFLYSGDADFDNMRGFMLSNGFDTVMGKESFSSDLNKRTWGYSDEDLYDKALKLIQQKEQAAQPYFLTLLTLSSHEPFDYPQGKTPLFPQAPAQSFANSTKYADFALGKFYAALKKEGLLENTVIALIGDHNSHPYGSKDVPIDRFHVAAVIMDDDVKENPYQPIASQIDFGPTLLDLAGLDVWLPSIGNSVFQNQRNSALLRYNQNYAYMNKDGFIVYKDGKPAQAYHDDYSMRTTSHDEVKDGLANILAPHLLYESQMYQVPKKE